MWQTFFRTCDFLCMLIPVRKWRNQMRRVQLYDWARKYKALRTAFPELNFRHTKMIKGGWNIGFIVDNKYVFKIRKNFDRNIPTDKIMHEKRITDAFANIVSLRIPKIDIINAGEYTFFKYDFIPGKNMNTLSQETIAKYKTKWGAQLGEFIYQMHNARPNEIRDLENERPGDGWNHHDICNNIIVDTKNMEIIGLIDWEYSGWGPLQTEFDNITAFSKKIRASGIAECARQKYNDLKKIGK